MAAFNCGANRPGCESRIGPDAADHDGSEPRAPEPRLGVARANVAVVDRPPVTDSRRIVDFVRSRGSVHYAKAAVPGEFAAWRRKIREAARAGGLSVSIIRTNDFVVIESRDYEVSADEDLATADVIDAAIAGRALSFVDALHARRRQRLRVV